MAVSGFESEGRDLGIIGHLLAGGEMVAAQLPSHSNWSPEKKLAAAVLAGALLEVRDRHADAHYRRRVAEDLTWIASNANLAWAYAFSSEGLRPAWVRRVRSPLAQRGVSYCSRAYMEQAKRENTQLSDRMKRFLRLIYGEDEA